MNLESGVRKSLARYAEHSHIYRLKHVFLKKRGINGFCG
jgi:hypothetical protein